MEKHCKQTRVPSMPKSTNIGLSECIAMVDGFKVQMRLNECLTGDEQLT